MSTHAIREQVVSIGKPTPLFGIYATRVSNRKASIALLLLNSGAIHRVGSCRLSVLIARAITENLGVPSLRFDYSGIGDSEPRRTTQSRDQLAVEEVKEAMDFVQQTEGIEKFVIYGLCSGARDAFRTCVSDPRVIGIAQVDGCAYRNTKYHLQHYRERVFNAGQWVKFVTESLPQHASRFFKKTSNFEDENMFVQEWEPYPPRQTVANDYAALVERKVQFYVLYTGSWVEQYNYKTQFFDMFSDVDFGDSITLKYRRETNHIHSDLADQKHLVADLREWISTVLSQQP